MRHLKTLSGHGAAIYKLFADGKSLFSASGDGMLASWDLSTFTTQPFSINVAQPIYAGMCHDHHILLGQAGGGIHVVDTLSKKELRHLKFHDKGVFALAFNTVFSHFYSAGGDGLLSVFSAFDYRLIIRLPLSGNKLRCLLLTPDNNYLLVGGSDGYIHIIETEYFNTLHSSHAHVGGCYSLQWLDKNQLISAGRDGHLRFWDFSPKGLKIAQEIPAHNYAIYDLALFQHGSFASASRDRQVKIWQYGDYAHPTRLSDQGKSSHSRSVNTLLFAEDILFTAGDDRQIKVWTVN